MSYITYIRINTIQIFTTANIIFNSVAGIWANLGCHLICEVLFLFNLLLSNAKFLLVV